MLADLIAATTAPTPSSPHDAYAWWSDIWVPVITGVASVTVAVSAVVVARKSNRLARASTRAAERSNALARRALRHEEQRALEETQRSDRSAREAYASRVTDALDQLADDLENRRFEEGQVALNRATAFSFEGVARDYSSAPVATCIDWLFATRESTDREASFIQARRSYRAAMAAWARDPKTIERTVSTLEDILKRLNRGEEI